MKPTWSNDRCDLYLADARDVLPTIGKVGLLCTDPPYGVAYSGRGSESVEIANDRPEDAPIVQAVLALAFDKLLPGRHAYSFEVSIGSPKVTARADLVWDKEIQGMGAISSWGKSHEMIKFHVRGAQGHKDKPTTGGELAARMRRGSVLRERRTHASGSKRHPTEKPIRLMQQLIESSSLVGDVVLDPFMGVGSTCVAAILLGRRAIGIELDPGYFEIARERCMLASQFAAAGDLL